MGQSPSSMPELFTPPSPAVVATPPTDSPTFKVLSVIPPMTQLNTPYPSTAYLTGFLRSRGIDAVQEDLALALVLQLFTPAGLEALRSCALAQPEAQRTASVHSFLDQCEAYRATIGPPTGTTT